DACEGCALTSPLATISFFALFVFCGMSARYGKIGDLQKLQRTRKFKRLRRSRRKAANMLAGIARSQPDLFVHWRLAPPYKAG
ncbi:MAG: hypothetical protein ACRD0K_13130, partial [Egibacteraceae bacterium]